MTETGKVVRLYFDDSGSRLPDDDEEDRNDGINGFALGGILIKEQDVLEANKRHAAFMKRWGLAGPLHSTKLRGFRHQFRFLRNNADQSKFFGELEDLLAQTRALGIACVIHRPGYNARYKEAHGPNRWKMCKTATAILAERSSKYADAEEGAKLKILFEETGKREDRDIIAYVRDLKTNGMPFNAQTSAAYGTLKAEDFKRIILGDPERITKKAGLAQIADLFLYPMIKGGYDPSYPSYGKLVENRLIIDCVLPADGVSARGVKYSCFDFKNAKGPV